MNRIVFFVFIITFLFACGSGTEHAPVPENILPKEKMVEIMVEVNLAEAALNLQYVSDNKVSNSKEYEEVFKRKNISRVQYDESLEYYTQYPELLTAMYDEVLNELSKMQAEVATHNPAQKPVVNRADSSCKPARSIVSKEKKKN